MLIRHKGLRALLGLVVAAGVLLLMPLAAFGTCTVNATTPGALSVFSVFVFPSSAGSITITNDSAGTHSVTIPGIDALVAPVQGVDLDGFLTLTPQVISGPNAGAGFGGSDSSARTLTLANAGTDVINLSVQGTLDSTAKAGTYQVLAEVTCT